MTAQENIFDWPLDVELESGGLSVDTICPVAVEWIFTDDPTREKK